MSSVQDIRQGVESIISGLTPEVRAWCTFRKANTRVQLEVLPVSGTADETTRQFRVVPGPVEGEGLHNGIDVDLTIPVEVQVRYLVDASGDAAGADELVDDMISSDSVRILAGVLRPNLATNPAVSMVPQIDIRFESSDVYDSPEVDGIRILVMRFRAHYYAEV